MIFSIVNRGESILGRFTDAGSDLGWTEFFEWSLQAVMKRGSRIASPNGPTNIVPQQTFLLKINNYLTNLFYCWKLWTHLFQILRSIKSDTRGSVF